MLWGDTAYPILPAFTSPPGGSLAQEERTKNRLLSEVRMTVENFVKRRS